MFYREGYYARGRTCGWMGVTSSRSSRVDFVCIAEFSLLSLSAIRSSIQVLFNIVSIAFLVPLLCQLLFYCCDKASGPRKLAEGRVYLGLKSIVAVGSHGSI